MAKKMLPLNLSASRQESVAQITAAYPYALHRTDFTDSSVPWHWHEEVEISYQIEGMCRIVTNHRTYLLHAGEALFMNSNVLSFKEKANESGPSRAHDHIFHPVLITGYFHSIYETRYVNPILRNPQIEAVLLTERTENGRRALRLLAEMEKLSGREHTEIETRNYLSEIWLYIYREIEENGVASLPSDTESTERLRGMLICIQNRCGEKLSVKEIAAAGGVSERECLRCFRANLKTSPVGYLTEFRLQKAREFLGKGTLPVTEIALQCGFSGSAYFGKIFRDHYGMTPVEYRKEYSQDTAEETAAETADAAAGRAAGRTADVTADATAGSRAADRTADATAGRAAGRAADVTAGRTAGRAAGRAADVTAGRTSARTAGKPAEKKKSVRKAIYGKEKN